MGNSEVIANIVRGGISMAIVAATTEGSITIHRNISIGRYRMTFSAASIIIGEKTRRISENVLMHWRGSGTLNGSWRRTPAPWSSSAVYWVPPSAESGIYFPESSVRSCSSMQSRGGARPISNTPSRHQDTGGNKPGEKCA